MVGADALLFLAETERLDENPNPNPNRVKHLSLSFTPALKQIKEQLERLKTGEKYQALEALYRQLNERMNEYLYDEIPAAEFRNQCKAIINDSKEMPIYKTHRSAYGFSRLLDNMGKAIDSLVGYVLGKDEAASSRCNAYRFFHIATTTERRLDEMLAGLEAVKDDPSSSGDSISLHEAYAQMLSYQ